MRVSLKKSDVFAKAVPCRFFCENENSRNFLKYTKYREISFLRYNGKDILFSILLLYYPFKQKKPANNAMRIVVFVSDS